jgi:uncharacterized RDD family membrane protein YckC
MTQTGMTALDNRLEIQTGDGVTFTLPLAGLVRRALAMAIDMGAVGGAFYFLLVLSPLLPRVLKDLSAALRVLIVFLVAQGYTIGLEWFWGGRTLGKRVMGIRVADARGLRLTVGQIVIRNLLRAVDSLPVFSAVGGMVALFNARTQRLGDLAAGTIVIWDGEIRVPELPPGRTGRLNSLASYRTLCARLRHRTGPELAQIALEALRRRDQFEPAARLAVFAELAAGFRSLMEFPEAATQHLADEQYLWNVVDILFERHGGKVSTNSHIFINRSRVFINH